MGLRSRPRASGPAQLRAAVPFELHRLAAPLVVAVALALGAFGGALPAGVRSGVVAAVAVAGVTLLAFLEDRRLVVTVGALLAGATGVTLAGDGMASAGLVGFGALVVSGAVALVLLRRMTEVLRDRERRYRDLFDRVPVGLYRTAISGEILEANPALADLMGLPMAEVMGRIAGDFFVDPEDFERLRSHIEHTTESVISDLRFLKGDGTEVWIRDHTRPVTDAAGRTIWFEGELQDVTEEKRHVAELEAAVRSKSELIAAVSHELRTPLTAVVGFLDLLRDADDLSQETELVCVAADQARDMAAIVEDLLTAARIDNGDLVIASERVRLRDAVMATIPSFDTDGLDIGVAVPGDLCALADGSRVRQILRNLVSNAVRHGEAPVVVRGVEDKGMATVIVADAGAPIPDATAERMFSAFFSGGAGGGRPGSMGLGLAVSLRLSRVMSGSLTYERVDEENRFVLDLPLLSEQRAGGPADDIFEVVSGGEHLGPIPETVDGL